MQKDPFMLMLHNGFEMIQQLQSLENHVKQDVFAKMSGKALADVIKMWPILLLTNC